MTKYESLIYAVRSCDYRVTDESACGCESGQIRCLLGRGTWDKDRHQVNTNDCLECTKGGENGRALDKTAQVTAGANGNQGIGYFFAK